MITFSNTYFDNASTSWPKPVEVGKAMDEFLRKLGGTYGRAAYGRVYQTSMIVEQCRNAIGEMLGVSESGNIVFTANATVGLNAIISGLDLHRCEVLVSPLEHNAVMRPLQRLSEKADVTWKLLPAGTDGRIIPEKVPEVISSKTRLIIVNHQSNVNGVLQPVDELRQYTGQIPLVVDVTQSLGNEPVQGDKWGAGFIAFTGHKGLLGPTGTGGFFVRNPEKLSPFFFGGTGSRSESFEMPQFSPDKYEAGTHNTVGLSGLLAALNHRPKQEWTREKFKELIQRLRRIKDVRILGADDFQHQGGLFSIAHSAYPPSTIARRVYDKFGIEIRSGLHCAPQAHKYLDTFPTGSARFAFSPWHTNDDLEKLGDVLEEVLK
ncbi:aminotransferase class V-fold PLP-dependent enzyme [Anaerophaga thermohalophila]|uniref:aminotransferase class V-fold PLP-dependent enzyme n=1 Tax=Anaerophaga thermohalophila TaxID=177400 RepID=UPI000237C416|nr:aminotransferase class V-fold PLP-dependent enzyme [Anaerophaga thermohalophila]